MVQDELTLALLAFATIVPFLSFTSSKRRERSDPKRYGLLFAQVVLPALTVASAFQGVDAVRGDLREAKLSSKNANLELQLARSEISSLNEELERAVTERERIASGVAMNNSTGLRIEDVLDQLGEVLISIEAVTAKSLTAAKAVQKLNIEQCEFSKFLGNSSIDGGGAQGGVHAFADCGSMGVIFGEESNQGG